MFQKNVRMFSLYIFQILEYFEFEIRILYILSQARLERKIFKYEIENHKNNKEC